MKKKLIVMAAVAFLMAMATLPCFAEIRVDRGGYTENGISCNTAIYWNDKYDNLSVASAEVQSMYVVKNMRGFLEGMSVIKAHLYIFHGAVYKVIYMTTEYNFLVNVTCQYENGYNENLYGNGFSSSNAAKAQFDSFCQQYYNKIAK